MIRERLDHADDVNYQVPYEGRLRWPEHELRISVTAAMVSWLKPDRALDPACGDGEVLLRAHALRPIEFGHMSDISGANVTTVRSKIRNWRWAVDALPVDFMLSQSSAFDVVVLSEILEHLPDPLATLRAARKAARLLVASSPAMREGQHDWNREHLWQFDIEGYAAMIQEAGWELGPMQHLRFDSDYDFQIWCAR